MGLSVFLLCIATANALAPHSLSHEAPCSLLFTVVRLCVRWDLDWFGLLTNVGGFAGVQTLQG